MDRYWFLTWTTYGSWLPGDRRGFVSNVRDQDGIGERHNQPGQPCDADLPALAAYMRRQMKGPGIYLTPEQVPVLLAQFQETAAYRGWLLLAVALMANHIHVVVGVPGDPDPSDVLGDLKSYGSRALNRRWRKPPNGTWWTESGSKRKLANEFAVHETVDYVVRRQPYPLLTWENLVASGGRQPAVEPLENGGCLSDDFQP